MQLKLKESFHFSFLIQSKEMFWGKITETNSGESMWISFCLVHSEIMQRLIKAEYHVKTRHLEIRFWFYFFRLQRKQFSGCFNQLTLTEIINLGSNFINETLKKQTRTGCFSIFFFENKNLILFPLLDSTDASRIHSDNKPRREENPSVQMKTKFSGESEESFSNTNNNATLEE